ncbi:MAG: LamG domain-containing protein [Gammaproteobacteria bacterium]|nr:LamG domain-containing protein [Gammaproteobacteria bacterium]
MPRTTIPSPFGGLNTIAAKAAMPIQDAVSMSNWYPDTGEVKARNGSTALATSVGSGDVSTLSEYNSGTIRKLLAASEDTIFDVANELNYSTDAVVFDGSNDYLQLNSAFTGISDGKQGTISAWVKFDAAGDGGAQQFILQFSSQKVFSLEKEPSGGGEKLKLLGENSSGTGILDVESTNIFNSSDGWVNILISFDLSDTSKRHFYVNDVDELVVTTYTNDNIDFDLTQDADPRVTVGANEDGTLKFNGFMSDLWFDTTYIDLSVTENRRKFLTDNGRPVDLGSDGSTPTGSQPILFLKGDESAFITNKGTGGGFTETGALADTSDTPSQQTRTLKTGFTIGRWQTANFNAQQLWVNGRDTPQVFNGQTFSNSTISGPTDVTKLVGVNIFKNRVYVWEEDSQDFWYGATNAIGGVFTKFPLSRVGRKGGKLVFMATWTIDGGEGQDDHAVFVMSTGETLIYKGSSPADTNWSLIGVFEIGEPLGIRAWTKVGGDILIATREDHVFLGDVLRNRVKRSKISGKARDDAKLYADNTGWEIINYPQGGMLLVNVPVSSTNFDQHVLNTVTGAWTTFDGMNARTWATFKGDLVFGGGSGTVFKADTGSDDNGTNISLSCEQAWTDLGAKRRKLLNTFEPILESSASQTYTAGFAVDFEAFPTLPTLTHTPSGVNEQGAEGYGRMIALKVTADTSQDLSWHGTEISFTDVNR